MLFCRLCKQIIQNRIYSHRIQLIQYTYTGTEYPCDAHNRRFGTGSTPNLIVSELSFTNAIVRNNKC